MPVLPEVPDAAELARLLLALESDEATAKAQRAERDRALRASLPPEATEVVRLRAWLARVDPDGERVEEHAASALGAVTTALVLLGAACGIAGALGVFYYDGSGRVNVLAILGVLVALPLVLLLLSWLTAALGPRSGTLPLLGEMLRGIGRLAPGRLADPIVRALSSQRRRALDTLLGHRRHDDTGVAAVRRWLVVRWSHLCGLGFFSGALLAALALIVFTDLAFGWSTTLSVAAAELHRLVQVVALPWGWALPDANPAIGVIEATRYFRAGADTLPGSDPELLGRWWSFLVMTLVVYGLLPRALSALVADKLLRRAVTRAFAQHPQARTLLERLAPAPVETQSFGPVADSYEEAPAPRSPAAWPPLDLRGAIVNWDDVPLDDSRLGRALGGSNVHHAGGKRSIAEDRALIEALTSDGNNPNVIVVCKAWEPPLLELQDFLHDVERAPHARAVVLPVRIDSGALRPPTARDVHVWQRAFAVNQVALASLPERAPGE